jgi:hypothetical protein
MISKMPSANHTVAVVFKISNPVHTAVYKWLSQQADSSSELMRDAAIAIYGYQAIEQSDLPPDQKARALLASNAELNKFIELNKGLASLPSNLAGNVSLSPTPTEIPCQPPASTVAIAADDEEDDDEGIVIDVDDI